MPNGRVWTRPINLLIPLEVESEMEKEEPDQAQIADPPKADPEKDQSSFPKKIKWADKPPVPDNLPQKGRRQRQAHKITGLTLLSLLCLNLGKVGAVSQGIICDRKGVIVKPPQGTSNIDICCGGACATRAVHTTFFYPLPDDILITGFICESTSWTAPNTSIAHQIECPAIDVCLLIDCIFCWDIIFNPQCSPWIAAALIGGLCGLILTLCLIFCCILTCCRRILRNLRWLWRICCLFKIWKDNRRTASPVREDIFREFISRQPKKKKSRPLTRLGYALALAISLCAQFSVSEAGAEAISLTANTEECWRKENSTECRFNSVTAITLLPAGQEINLNLKEQLSKPFGSFTFILKELTLECMWETITHIRSYKIETLSSKRCPGAGSCSGDRCEKLRPNETVPELQGAENSPGANFCVESTSFLLNGCASPTDACLFYRIYAVPISEQAYEIFECPTWEFRARVYLRLTLPNTEIIEEEVVLHPGFTFHWGVANLSLTPSPFGQPPIPLLNSKFVATWDQAALATDIPSDLSCPTELYAQMFKCSLSPDACSHCRPEHSNGQIRCHCREADIEAIMMDESRKLPLEVGQIKINYFQDRLWAQLHYTPVQVMVKVEGLTLAVQHELTLCQITPSSLSGCYNCRTGGRFIYKCQSSFGETLASVVCDDGTSWVANCAANVTHHSITLNWRKATVQTVCKVECGGGTTQFPLNGTLVFVPSRQTRWKEASSQIHSPADKKWLNLPAWDGAHILSLLLTPTNITIFVGVILSIFIFLFFFVKLNPIFRAYRLLSRLILIFLLFSSLT